MVAFSYDYPKSIKGGENMEGTTLGKGWKTLVWLVFSNAIVFLLTQITQNPDLYSPIIVGLANVMFVLAKNFLDPKVRNL